MNANPVLEAQVGAWAETQLKPKRIPHVRGVVTTAAQLAERYAPQEVTRVRLAGWIHDVAKDWDDARLLDFAEAHALPVTPVERVTPMLLHGAVGYVLAAERFDLNDPLLREACTLHTTGAPDMSLPAKIVFVADLSEPTRKKKRARKLRREMQHSLDSAVLLAADSVLRYLIKKGRVIDPRTVALHNALLQAGVSYRR